MGDLRIIEVIISEIEHLKVNKMEKLVARVDRTIETTATEVKANHMTCTSITMDTIP